MTTHMSDETQNNKAELLRIADEAGGFVSMALLQWGIGNPDANKFEPGVLTAVALGTLVASNEDVGRDMDFCVHCLAKAFEFGLTIKRMQLGEARGVNANKH